MVFSFIFQSTFIFRLKAKLFQDGDQNAFWRHLLSNLKKLSSKKKNYILNEKAKTVEKKIKLCKCDSIANLIAKLPPYHIEIEQGVVGLSPVVARNLLSNIEEFQLVVLICRYAREYTCLC